jgi:hypothetical protein
MYAVELVTHYLSVAHELAPADAILVPGGSAPELAHRAAHV